LRRRSAPMGAIIGYDSVKTVDLFEVEIGDLGAPRNAFCIASSVDKIVVSFAGASPTRKRIKRRAPGCSTPIPIYR